MSVISKENFHQGVPSELALFDLPPTQVGVSDVYYEEIRPQSQVIADAPIEFCVNGQNSMDYLDLSGSQLYVKLKVKKADGTNLTSTNKVGPVNLFFQALFSTVEVTLQNKATITCNFNPYRAMIKTLLNFGQDAKKSQLESQLFVKDDNDSPAVTDPAGTNQGLFDRTQYVKLSKTLDMQGPLHHDLASLTRYILNEVDVKLKLYRTSPAFSLNSGDATATNYVIDIQDIYLLARKIRVNPAVIYGHAEMLKTTNAKYPYTKSECRVQSVAAGSTSFHWENMFQGQRPRRVIVAFVKAKAVTGDYKANPFDFENCDIQNICLFVDGLAVGGSPTKVDFDATGGYAFMRAYVDLTLAAGKWNVDAGNDIGRLDFAKGSTLFAFELEPSFAQHGEYLTLVKSGNVRLDVQFKTALAGKLSKTIINNNNNNNNVSLPVYLYIYILFCQNNKK
jgi:hypothetical protein